MLYGREEVEVVLLDGYQLDLWEDELEWLPWRGRSPRALTRGHLGIIFTARAGGARAELNDPLQGELFEAQAHNAKRRASYAGAPCLLPLPRRS